MPTFGAGMKKILPALLFILFTAFFTEAVAQCSICTKTAAQMGAKPAEGLNTGILYLMAIPYLAVAVVGYKWWKSRKDLPEDE